jgi:hypothetical protein
MTVLRDGYFDGGYFRRGDTLVVALVHVKTLEMAGFAVRQTTPPTPRPTAKGKV